MAYSDLSTIALLFSAVQGMKEIASLSDNRHFLLEPAKQVHDDFWRLEPGHSRPSSVFALSFGQRMYSPRGWIFGSSGDTDICDFQLTDSATTTVSRRHFRIDIEPGAHRPRITVISSNPIRIHVEHGQRKRKPVIPLEQGAHLEIKDPVIIDLGEVQLRAWQPKLSIQEVGRYNRNAERFSADFMDSILRLPLDLRTSGASTYTMRFGLNETCYKIYDTSTGRMGSFASVSRVKEIRTGEYYAAKIPHFRTTDAPSRSQARWEALKAELGRIRILHHPYVVRAFEVIPGNTAADPPWLIMEWMEHDLQSHLESHRIDTRDQFTLFSNVVQGLAFMHQHSLIHRDLKPSNILLDLQQDGRLQVAKIGDFGSSKQHRSDYMRSHVGTSIYMAPEFWEQSLSYSNAIDLWSFGIIALQCLTVWDAHRAAWDKTTWPTRDEHLDWIQAIKGCELPAVPEMFRPMLDGLLATSAAARWSALQTGAWLSERAVRHNCSEAASSIRTSEAFENRIPSSFTVSPIIAGNRLPSPLNPASNFEEDLGKLQWDDPVPKCGVDSIGKAKDCAIQIARDGNNISVSQYEISLAVNGRTVALRKIDHYMDAAEILAVARVTYNERRNVLEQVRRKTGQVCLDRRWGRVWISYGHSLLLSDYVKATSELQPLFDFANKHLSPSPTVPADDLSRYLDQYLTVQTKSACVSVRKRDHRVNLSHVMRASNCTKRERYNTLAAYQTCERVVKVPKRHVGLYCAPEESLGLCERLGLKELKANLEAAIQGRPKGVFDTMSRVESGQHPSSQATDSISRMMHSIFTEPDSGDFLPQMPPLI